MKKYLPYIAAILFCTSCDVLDVEPYNSIPASEAFKNAADLERGILGAYSSFQSLSYYGRTYSIFADLAADNLVHPDNATAVAYAEVDNNAILPENSSVDGIWFAIYDGINVANNVLSKVDGIPDLTETQRNEARAELYFIRALHHFNLLNYFGPVPLKTAPTVGLDNINVARDNTNDVFNQIISDLTFSSEHLPASGGKIRASSQAADALLARVFLYKKDYLNAAAAASKVINSGKYSLLPDYADIFASEENSESIFEIDYNTLDRNRIAEYNFPLAENGRGEVAPASEFVASYAVNDERLATTFAYSGTAPFVIKYDDLSTGADNFVVLRFAEMYLIHAEATCHLEGNIQMIKEDINQLRNRAGLGNITASAYSDLLLSIEAERRFEFAFEGHRWFDLVRTGRAIEVLPTVTSVNQTLFPIPLSEIITNTDPGMYQNPGY